VSSVIAASAGRVVLRVKATTVAQVGSPGPTLERMNVRMTLTGGCAAVVALLSATFGISAASPTSPGPKRDRATQMFARKEFSRAIDRLKNHAGGSVKLLDVALSTTTADFLYETNGRQVNFKVAVHGARVAKGRSIVVGGRAFGLPVVHTGIPQGLIRQIRKRPGLRRFVPEIVDLGAMFSRSPEWQVTGKTDSSYSSSRQTPTVVDCGRRAHSHCRSHRSRSAAE
jgi:hypothetical protein